MERDDKEGGCYAIFLVLLALAIWMMVAVGQCFPNLKGG